MTTKPRDFKAEYARRIANATSKGKTRQQARGHVAQEHVFRKQREIEENEGLTRDNVKRIRSWYSTFNPGHKEIPDVENVIDFAREEGYDKFKTYRKVWDQARRTYLREQSKGTYASRGLGYLEMLTDMAGVRGQEDDIKWLYYH